MSNSKTVAASLSSICSDQIIGNEIIGKEEPVDDEKRGTRSFSALSPVRSHLIAQLRGEIQNLETAGRADDGQTISSGCAEVDHMLPGGGYSCGTIVEWLTPRASGADILSLHVARQACADGGALVVFDERREFYPPAAAAFGVNLDNLIVLRPQKKSDLYWTIDQSLRCSAVAAVWGSLETVSERWLRRFQLSAESSGCLGLFLRPLAAADRPSWAEVQWAVESNSVKPLQNRRTVRLRLRRCRAAATGKVIDLQINTITGTLHARRQEETRSLPVNSQLARSTARRRPARA